MIRQPTVAAMALLVQPVAALALDFSAQPPVAEVTDAQVSVGKRSVQLPPGPWTFIAYAKSSYVTTGNASMSTPRHTGYFAAGRGAGFRGGLVVEMGEIPLPSPQWLNDPCTAEGKAYKSLLDSTALHPECLLVNQRPTLHRFANAGFYKDVSDWLAAQGVDQAAPVYDIHFMHFSATGQGMVRLFVPTRVFASQQAAVDWAKALPAAMRPLLSGRSSTATLPALP